MYIPQLRLVHRSLASTLFSQRYREACEYHQSCQETWCSPKQHGPLPRVLKPHAEPRPSGHTSIKQREGGISGPYTASHRRSTGSSIRGVTHVTGVEAGSEEPCALGLGGSGGGGGGRCDIRPGVAIHKDMVDIGFFMDEWGGGSRAMVMISRSLVVAAKRNPHRSQLALHCAETGEVCSLFSSFLFFFTGLAKPVTPYPVLGSIRLKFENSRTG